MAFIRAERRFQKIIHILRCVKHISYQKARYKPEINSKNILIKFQRTDKYASLRSAIVCTFTTLLAKIILAKDNVWKSCPLLPTRLKYFPSFGLSEHE